MIAPMLLSKLMGLVSAVLIAVLLCRRKCFSGEVLLDKKGELTMYGGKRPAQAALSACDYRF